MTVFFRLRGVAIWTLAAGLALGIAVGDARAQSAPKKSAPVAKGAPAGQAKDGQVFEDWTARCGPNGCNLSQSQFVEGGARLIQFSIGRIGSQGELGAVAVVPLGIHIPAGALLVMDGKTIPFIIRTCTQQGCQASSSLTTAQLGEIGKAQALEVALMDDANRQSMMIPLSVKGLSQGLAAVR